MSIHKSMGILILLSFILMVNPDAAGQNGQTLQEREQSLINPAFKLLGTPYRYGGTSPSGFDCSGFIQFLYTPLLPGFPRTSANQSQEGIIVSSSTLVPGDLLFYATRPGSDAITNVGLYVGRGAVIQAVSDGPETGVLLTDMDEKYWKKRLRFVRRVLPLPVLDNPESPESSMEPAPEGISETVPDSEGDSFTREGNTYILTSWSAWTSDDERNYEIFTDEETRGVDQMDQDWQEWKKNN